MAQQNQNQEQNQNQSNKSSQKGTSNRGFAAMDPAEQREIASKGGKVAHEKGTAHEFTPEEAAEAGRKGGEAVSRNREHMAEIGSKGGQARAASSAKSRSKPASEQSAGSSGKEEDKNQ